MIVGLSLNEAAIVGAHACKGKSSRVHERVRNAPGGKGYRCRMETMSAVHLRDRITERAAREADELITPLSILAAVLRP